VWQGQAFAWVAVVASIVQLELLFAAHVITVDPTLGLWALPRQKRECSCVTSSLFCWTGPHACRWCWLGQACRQQHMGGLRLPAQLFSSGVAAGWQRWTLFASNRAC